MTRFKHFPTVPTPDSLTKAFLILKGAHDASTSFLEIFEATRKARKAKGTPTDEEQDLFRAMFVFACSGFDYMLKQLVRDTLLRVINKSDGAEANFRTFVGRRLKQEEKIDYAFLAEVIGSKNPRSELIQELQDELTSRSLQSKDEVFKVAAYLDIPSRDISSRPSDLEALFAARNQIAHEMDVDFNQPNRNRRSRRKNDMIGLTNQIFQVADIILQEVGKRV